MFLRDAPGFSLGLLFWGIGTKRRQRMLAEALSLPSCTGGSHPISMTHILPLLVGFCPPSSLSKAGPGGQEQEGSWDPEEFMTLRLSSPNSKERL